MAVVPGHFGTYSKADTQSMLEYQIRQNDYMISQNDEIIRQIKAENSIDVPEYLNLFLTILQICTILFASGFIYYIVRSCRAAFREFDSGPSGNNPASGLERPSLRDNPLSLALKVRSFLSRSSYEELDTRV